jgi:hypothetical protein
MWPVRIIAVGAALTLFLLALTDEVDSRFDVPLMIAISVIAVLDNGLEATAITEFAGPFWSGRALGVQNTTQRLMAAAGPPLFGALIAAAKYTVGADPIAPARLRKQSANYSAAAIRSPTSLVASRSFGRFAR